jgi:hypothetical protein
MITIIFSMEKDKTRLLKLIEHWAEHNDEHKARFEESAKKAEDMGLQGTAKNLRAASESATNVSRCLRKALESFR